MQFVAIPHPQCLNQIRLIVGFPASLPVGESE
jgi:hypothetical protein